VQLKSLSNRSVSHDKNDHVQPSQSPQTPSGSRRCRCRCRSARHAGFIGRARAEGPLKVAAIYTVPVEQQWVSRIHKAANAAVARGDIEYVFSENTSNNDYERVMREYSEAGHDLIIGEVFAVEDAARQVARDYPETAYLMGSSFLPKDDAPNFAVFDNYIQDASYLSGIIAGAMTKSKNIGMVGGFPIPEVNRLMHAFMAGVKETAPDTKFQVAFIGSWFDPPKAKETAFAQIDAGADILYAERFGVSDAAKEKGILAIGNVIDTQADYPGHRRRLGAVAFRADARSCGIEMVKAGTFKAENYGVYSFMKEGGCSLAPLGTFEGKVPEEALKLVAEKEAAIKDGDFRGRDQRRRAEVQLMQADHRPEAETVLRLSGITKRFGPLVANDAISLSI
jgi:basic membrane protein A